MVEITRLVVPNVPEVVLGAGRVIVAGNEGSMTRKPKTKRSEFVLGEVPVMDEPVREFTPSYAENARFVLVDGAAQPNVPTAPMLVPKSWTTATQ